MQRVVLALGVLLCLGVWLSPDAWIAWPFTDHMVRHIVLVAIATLAVAAGIRSWPAPAVSPLAAVPAEFVIVWGWHLPSAHAAAQTSPIWYVAEQASFFVAGLLVWRSAFNLCQCLAGAGGLLLTSMHMTLLGALLILAPRALYPPSVCGSLADQQLGGILMLAIGTPVYLVAGLGLTAFALRERGSPT